MSLDTVVFPEQSLLRKDCFSYLLKDLCKESNDPKVTLQLLRRYIIDNDKTVTIPESLRGKADFLKEIYCEVETEQEILQTCFSISDKTTILAHSILHAGLAIDNPDHSPRSLLQIAARMCYLRDKIPNITYLISVGKWSVREVVASTENLTTRVFGNEIQLLKLTDVLNPKYRWFNELSKKQITFQTILKAPLTNFARRSLVVEDEPVSVPI